jgi:hypothetical protein
MSTVASVNTEDRSRGAVPRIVRKTQCAFAATGVDLTDDAFPNQKRIIVGLFDHAHKLVADRSIESRVTADDLEIRVADPGSDDANKRFAVDSRYRNVVQMRPSLTYP